jgi:hypothetical protein
MTGALFDLPDGAYVAPVPPEKLSAGRRLTLRQKRDVETGRHPLTGGPLHAETGRLCGNCRHRFMNTYYSRPYPKCAIGPITGGVGTDVRAWWPACRDHEWGDPKLSPDAARSGPPS